MVRSSSWKGEGGGVGEGEEREGGRERGGEKKRKEKKSGRERKLKGQQSKPQLSFFLLPSAAAFRKLSSLFFAF